MLTAKSKSSRLGFLFLTGGIVLDTSNDYAYDIEVFPNIFTVCIGQVDSDVIDSYEISDRKNQLKELLDDLRDLRKRNCNMVGFNNIGFDYPVIHFILEKVIASNSGGGKSVFDLTGEQLAAMIYKQAMKFIDSDNRFGNTVKDPLINQIDLYKIWHFDNKARATSLKMLEFNMRSDEIDDLPFPVGTRLDDEQKDELIRYNKKDVRETIKFYHYSKEALQLRKDLSEKFGFDCTNFNDTKIGKQLFINRLEEEQPGVCYTPTQHGRSINQTKRESIAVADCLFPYINFERNRPEFYTIHQWFKRQVITETKGVFSDIPEHLLGDVAKYAEMVVKRKKVPSKPTEQEIAEFNQEYPLGWIEEVELKATEYAYDENGEHILEYPNGDATKKPKKKRVPKKSYYKCWNIAETLNVVINGFRYDFGTGGIHGAKQGVHRSNDDRKIYTLDVRSYYPNMAIANNVFPAHLGLTFCKVYNDLYEERAASPKGSAPNDALKLALNGTYGDSNNEFSPLYDPQYTMTITIGGQLSLCMLMGALIDLCDAEIIMCNTDGFEYICHKDRVAKAEYLVKRWEQVTGLEMEGDIYDAMYIRDVNSYLSITESGKVKTKGAYEYLPYEKLGWHKNHSAQVIPMAVYEHLVNGRDYKEVILNHNEPFDFMLRTKVPRSSRLVLVMDDGTEIQQQNICRYYPSKTGGKLVKIMPPLEGKEDGGERDLSIDSEWKVKTCNKMVDFDWEIDYDYYIRAVEKLLEPFKETPFEQSEK